jgi:hypothetical protein
VWRSGKDEPMWVVIYMCLEAMLGISVYRYLYLKLAKCYIFLIISYAFSSTKLENKGWKKILPGKGVGEVAQTMYAHVSKFVFSEVKKKDDWNIVLYAYGEMLSVTKVGYLPL